jgi:hypothetical protein
MAKFPQIFLAASQAADLIRYNTLADLMFRRG